MQQQRMSNVVPTVTYAEAARIARRTPFGGHLSEEVSAALAAKAARQAARTDMTPGERLARRRELQWQTGVIR